MNQNMAQSSNNLNQASVKEHNIVDFKKESIKLLLDQLQEKGIIEKSEDKKQLFDIYDKDSRDIYIIFEEIKNLNKTDVSRLLNKVKAEKEPEPIKIPLNNVTDFKNDETGKKYISIHYPYPDNRIKVVENLTDKTAKELFEEKKDANDLVSIDGLVDAADVYENHVEPNKNEVKMYNVTELARRGEFQKLTKEERKTVIGVVTTIVNELAGLSEIQKQKLKKAPVDELIKMFDKDVFLSPKENIVMICTPNTPQDDKIMTVTQDENGEYKLTSLNATGYDYVGENNAHSNTSESTSNSSEGLDNEEVEKEKGDLGSSMKMKSPWEKRKKAS